MHYNFWAFTFFLSLSSDLRIMYGRSSVPSFVIGQWQMEEKKNYETSDASTLIQLNRKFNQHAGCHRVLWQASSPSPRRSTDIGFSAVIIGLPLSHSLSADPIGKSNIQSSFGYFYLCLSFIDRSFGISSVGGGQWLLERSLCSTSASETDVSRSMCRSLPAWGFPYVVSLVPSSAGRRGSIKNNKSGSETRGDASDLQGTELCSSFSSWELIVAYRLSDLIVESITRPKRTR